MEAHARRRRRGLTTNAADTGLNRVLATAARLSLPVNLYIAGRLDQDIELIRRNCDTQITVDHLGPMQPHDPSGGGGAVGRAAENVDADCAKERCHEGCSATPNFGPALAVPIDFGVVPQVQTIASAPSQLSSSGT
jgi:hypothetical protein